MTLYEIPVADSLRRLDSGVFSQFPTNTFTISSVFFFMSAKNTRWEIVERSAGFYVVHTQYKTCRHNEGPFSTKEEAHKAWTAKVAQGVIWGQCRSEDILASRQENELLKEMGVDLVLLKLAQ